MSDIPQRLAAALADRYVLEREIGAEAQRRIDGLTGFGATMRRDRLDGHPRATACPARPRIDLNGSVREHRARQDHLLSSVPYLWPRQFRALGYVPLVKVSLEGS